MSGLDAAERIVGWLRRWVNLWQALRADDNQEADGGRPPTWAEVIAESQGVDRCNAPLRVRPQGHHGVILDCGERVGGRTWASPPEVALSVLLEQAQRHRDECQAGRV